MAQFRVELVLDEASGMYLAELYHPENENELVVRTEARYPTQAAALIPLRACSDCGRKCSTIFANEACTSVTVTNGLP